MARRPFLISFSLYFLSRVSSPLLKPKGSNTPPAQRHDTSNQVLQDACSAAQT